MSLPVFLWFFVGLRIASLGLFFSTPRHRVFSFLPPRLSVKSSTRPRPPLAPSSRSCWVSFLAMSLVSAITDDSCPCRLNRPALCSKMRSQPQYSIFVYGRSEGQGELLGGAPDFLLNIGLCRMLRVCCGHRHVLCSTKIRWSFGGKLVSRPGFPSAAGLDQVRASARPLWPILAKHKAIGNF